MYEVNNPIDILILIEESIEHLDKSIEMAAKNSSLRKDLTAEMYLKKELKNSGLTLSKYEKYNVAMCVIGRAMHNITYLDGPMKVFITDKLVTNEYKKLGINRVFKRSMEIHM